MKSQLAPGRPLRISRLASVWYPRSVLVAAGLIGLCLGLGWLLLMLGKNQLSIVEVRDALLLGPESSAKAAALWQYRLPRVTVGFVTGACLGLAGLVFQSLSRNSLGSPEIIGMVSGAAVGAVVGITILGTQTWATSATAVIGCAIAALLGYWLAGRSGDMVPRMVLIGIGLSAMWSALTELLLTRTDPNIAIGAQIWLIGSLNARTWEHTLPPTVALLLCLPVAVLHSRHLATLDLGPDMAGQLGLLLPRLTKAMVVCGVLLTGAAIASTGPISFISLAAPQIASRLVGSRTIPVAVSALVGATVLLFAEALVQLLPQDLRAPVGIVTSALGGIYLLVFLLRRRS